MDVQLNLIDLNTADPVELKNVPGIGSKLADRIIAARPFSNLLELRKVNGVGPALFEQVKTYMTVLPATGIVLQSESNAPSGEPDFSQETITPSADRKVEPRSAKADPSTRSSDSPKFVPPEVPEIEAEPLFTPVGEQVLQTSEAELSEPAPANPAPEMPAVIPALPDLPPDSPETVMPVQPEIKGISRAELYGTAAASGVFSFILAVLFTLLFLVLINGSLRFVKPAEVSQLASQVNKINAQANELNGEIDALKNSLTGPGGLDGRLTSVEQDARQLRNDLQTVSASADALGKRIDDLSFQVDALIARSGRFQTFLDGLRSLLNNLNPGEVK